VFYDDPAAAIDWLCRAFGFEVRLKIEGDAGVIEHSELTYGEAVVMVGHAGGRPGRPVPIPSRSPRALGGVITQALVLYVDDTDAHCARALAAGALIVEPPRTDDYGDDYWVDRSYRAQDPEGHHWWFLQRLAR
jgi:uncharacterized glyoxalase superfamily protein PhnB